MDKREKCQGGCGGWTFSKSGYCHKCSEMKPYIDKARADERKRIAQELRDIYCHADLDRGLREFIRRLEDELR